MLKPFVAVVLTTDTEKQAGEAFLKRRFKPRLSLGDGPVAIVELQNVFVVVIHTKLAGNLDATLETESALRLYHPAVVAVAGICGGFGIREYEPCDVVLSTHTV